MPKHIKPTSEELEESSKALAAEAEAMKEETPEVEEETPEVKEETPEIEEVTPEVEKEAPKEEVVSEDYKTKFIHSTKEAQMLYSKNKKMKEAFDNAGKVAPPTEEELKEEYSDWDVMSDFEKKIAKDNIMNTRRFEAIEEVNVDNKKATQWDSKVEEFITDPNVLVKYHSLEGKEEEFKLFATKSSRRGNEFDDIVSSFLYKIDQVKPVKNKGKMMESGTGGSNKKSDNVKKTLTIEEGRSLRERDYGKWKEMLRAGKIDPE